LGYLSALVLPVGRAVFFPGEFPLLSCIAVVLVGQIEGIHRQIFRGVDVAGDSEVNTNTVIGVNLTQ
jgi:hypothetical protein